VHKVVKMPNQSLFVFAEGLERVRLADFAQLTPFMRARVTTIAEIIPPKDSEIEALQRNVLTLFQQIVAGSPTLSDELSTVAMNIEEPGRLVDFIASSLPSLSTSDKQETLETTDVRTRLEKSTSTWPKNWKSSNCATRSNPKSRIACSRRSVSTTFANR